MKSNLLSILAVAASPLIAASTANAVLLGQWTFDGDTLGATANNDVLADGGVVGLPDGSGSVTIVAGGPSGGNYAEIVPSAAGLEGIAAPHISTGASIGDLGVSGNDNYTMGAWIRFDSQEGDNMVFGGNAGDVLHLGSRGANYWSGHWGDDINSADSPNTEAGVWHHVVWTNEASDMSQTIYVDGVEVATGGAGAAGGYSNNLTEVLLVGTSRNGGSFNGAIDDVRIYDNVISQGEINAWAGIPEPSGIALLGLAGATLIFRRRR